MKKVFESRTLTVWQIGALKFAVLAIGIAIGATWSEAFEPYVTVLVVVGAVLSAYLAAVWFRQE